MTALPDRRTYPGRRSPVAFLLTLLLVLASVVTTSTLPTQAATGTPISVDSISFSKQEFPDGSTQELTVRWSVPGEATNPVSVTVDLPAGLTGRADRFAMISPDGGPAGECVVGATTITCTVDPAYVDGHELAMSGEFTVRADVWLENLETVEHVFDFGTVDGPLAVTVTPNPDRCTESCTYQGQHQGKWGWYDNLTDTITWTVSVPAPGDGMPAGLDVVVEDVLDPTAYELLGTPTVYEGRSTSYDRLGREQADLRAKEPSDVTVSPDGLRVEFTSVAGAAGEPLPAGHTGLSGSVYRVEWTVRALDEGKATTYANTARYTIEGDVSHVVTGQATRWSGSGTVVGRNFGKLQLTKELHGDTTLTSAFSVRYTALLDGQVTDERTVELRDGQTFLTDELFKGTTVRLEEIAPTGPENVTWADPVFVQPDGTTSERLELTFGADRSNLGGVTEIRLVNRATLARAGVQAHKVVVNDDGLRLPQDLSFTLAYAWDAVPGLGIGAGSGRVTLPAAGDQVSVPDLPVGATVRFTEPAPRKVPGGTWSSPAVSPSEVLVTDASGTVDVTVTNTLTRDLGAFSLTKRLAGDGAGLVPDPTFTVRWSYPADPSQGIDEPGTGEVTVTAGEPAVVVDQVPAGARVTLAEVLDEVEGGTWGEPTFSEQTFTVIKDDVVAVDLDNLITLNAGFVSVRKAIEGTGAGLVPADDTFVVHYTYPAGTGFAAGDGRLVVPADGEAVTSGPLPYGAVLTLSELPPADVAGATWGEVGIFAPAAVTIGDGTTSEVTLTNTITRDVGAFALSKRVEGSGAALVAPQDGYTFTYSYPAGDTWSGLEPTTVSVPGDGTTVTVRDVPAGAVVTVRENSPEAVEGGAWSAPTYEAANSFVVTKDATYALDVVNSIERTTGYLSVRKDVVGTAAHLLPPDAEFVVRYAYPAGDGFAAGEGTVVVAADGVPVVSEPLPYGALVTLVEEAPAPVDGATWTEAALSTEQVRVGDGTVVGVVVTNTLDMSPARPGPGVDRLSNTGVTVPLALLGGAVLLVAGGATLRVAARRRRS
ncbi:DUF5979 domain-containing protein [Oerskovia sp. USHLN155]|uniref:DUF5979 domain-containing protein n=1 Tax=Oerskovia sp. USHLN155 TaxID=3081288 RepID=UPI003015EF33